jgi:hypothetical protein
MKQIVSVFSFFITMSLSFQIWAFKKTESPEKINGVHLTQNIEIEELGSLKLKSVAHGIRSKKVAFLNFKVYLGEVLVPQESNWNQTALEFLNANPAGFQMTFLRDVPADKLIEGFEAGLKENQTDMNSEPIKAFLLAVKKVGDLKENEAYIIARNKSEKTDDVILLIPGKSKEIVTGPSGWSDQILNLWAGKPTDSGIKNLQKELFK